MRVAQRLFLAVLPAVVGVFAVAALAYYGQYAHVVPEWLLAMAIIAGAGSLVVAWVNTRYVARRIDRLAARVGEGSGSTPREDRSVAKSVTAIAQRVSDAVAPRATPRGMPDEIDAIEQSVDRLSEAVSDAEEDRRTQLAAIATRRREYAELVSRASDSVSRALDDVRLPLHILLENRFGELNENQEEMLDAARMATDNAADEVRALRDIVDLDRGVVTLRNDTVRIADLLASLMPMLTSEGQTRQVEVAVDVTPGLPSLRADRRRLQESVSAILHDAVRRSPEGSRVAVAADADTHSVWIDVRHGAEALADTTHALPRRLLEANAATLEERPGRSLIRFARR